MIVITIIDILTLLCGLFLSSIFILCGLSDWQKTIHDNNKDDEQK